MFLEVVMCSWRLCNVPEGCAMFLEVMSQVLVIELPGRLKIQQKIDLKIPPPPPSFANRTLRSQGDSVDGDRRVRMDKVVGYQLYYKYEY